MKLRDILLIVIAIVALMGGTYLFRYRKPSAIDPRMTVIHLGGMTPDQVIAVLGAPADDPRKTRFTGSQHIVSSTQETEISDGPFVFDYNDMGLSAGRYWGHYYSIIFVNSHVTEVRAAP